MVSTRSARRKALIITVQGKKCQFIKLKSHLCITGILTGHNPDTVVSLGKEIVLEFIFLSKAHLAFFLSFLNLSQLVTSLNLTLFQMDLSKLPLT